DDIHNHVFFFSSRRRHTRSKRDWSSDVCSSDLEDVNQALHRALKEVVPGDILVVSGGGFSERALMGELIAQRAQNAGIIGMIIEIGRASCRERVEVWEVGD